ncbi:MAG TPA: 30S ribosomal protein S8 [Verrucomicrobiae bacterium]|nr:30S ribosomal protein S8 [Verrucomicrobiae bacterium]
MSSDPIADMLTRIRNANMALLPEVTMSHSNMRESIAKILKREGYIQEVSVDGKAGAKNMKLKLKYQGRKGVIAGLRRVSTPGLRRYVGATEIPRVLGGMGISILSTPRGVLSGTEARKQNVGGEVIAYIW